MQARPSWLAAVPRWPPTLLLDFLGQVADVDGLAGWDVHPGSCSFPVTSSQYYPLAAGTRAVGSSFEAADADGCGVGGGTRRAALRAALFRCYADGRVCCRELVYSTPGTCYSLVGAGKQQAFRAATAARGQGVAAGMVAYRWIDQCCQRVTKGSTAAISGTAKGAASVCSMGPLRASSGTLNRWHCYNTKRRAPAAPSEEHRTHLFPPTCPTAPALAPVAAWGGPFLS